MPNWEYRIVRKPTYDELLVELNDAGAEGWEAIAILEESTSESPEDGLETVVLMKRPAK